MEDSSYKYRNIYTGIFALNYLTQGLDQSVFTTVIPIYLLILLGSVEAGPLSFMISIISLPFILKLIFGLISDKVRFRRIGRRKPWIIGPQTFSGIMWIVTPFFIALNTNAAITTFTIIGFFVYFGVAWADTALDGFILDICPKKKIGRVTGTCWAFRSVGIIVGGPLLLLSLEMIDISFILIGLGFFKAIISFSTLLIKESETIKEVKMISNLKIFFERGENWKLYLFSLFIAIVDGVIFVFLALYILIQVGLVDPMGATIGILEKDLSLYPPQAFITFITGIGVLIGSLLGGQAADKKSRRFAVFLSAGLSTGSLLLLLIQVPQTYWGVLLVFACIIGGANGWKYSAFSSVASEYSKQYPEATSTFFATCNTFINIGTIIGLQITGILFETISEVLASDFLIYGVIFVFMALISNIALVPFLFMDRNQYEFRSQKD